MGAPPAGVMDTSHKTNQLGYRDIFFLWLPLALSRMMMNVASPIASAGIARLPDPVVNLAAYGLIHDMAILIESPIIMLLSTSVALARYREAYLLLRRFVIHLTLILLCVSFIIAYTPLYYVVFQTILGASEPVVEAARPAMQIMLLWPPAVGWRRFYQGIIIQYGQSRLITYGTIWRLAALALTIWIGVQLTWIPGAVVGAIALVVSVLIEMGIILWWSLPIVRTNVLTKSAGSDEPPLTYRALVKFYWPLAGTEFMRVLARPLTAAGVARAALPTLSLAAWPVGMSLAFLFASGVMSVQEVVVARLGAGASRQRLMRFAAGIGSVFTLLLAALIWSPAAGWYFKLLLGLPDETIALALPVARILCAMPFLFATRDFLRGLLIHHRRSGQVQTAMAANLLVLLLLLSIGVLAGGIQGALLAAVATFGAYLFEVVALAWYSRQTVASIRSHKQSARA